MFRVALCGSRRFEDEIFLAKRLLTESGLQVLAPPLHHIEELTAGRSDEYQALAWMGATFAHFNRLNKSDTVFIINPNGYIGPSTTLELGYATAQRKYITAMMPDSEEIARTILMDLIFNITEIEPACRELVRVIRETAEVPGTQR